MTPAMLVLADGSAFEGIAIGAPAEVSSGEVVFHTGLSGYQEVLSDPSYAGQIVTFTASHIGNYGTTPSDDESSRFRTRGVVVRDYSAAASSWRSTASFDDWLRRAGIAGISGVDTRRLTRILRDRGSVAGAFGTAPHDVLLAAAQGEPGTAGVNLVAQVSVREPYVVEGGPRRVVAYDFGIKRTILHCLTPLATVTVVPHSTPADEVLAMRPDGVFLSNGPGDPETVAGAPEAIRTLLNAGVPVFGICLGHQLLALALGGRTFKLPFGHHGANHPVRNLATGAVEITSQNHNFCVEASSLGGAVTVTHLNLNDGTNEGMRVEDTRAFSVQYHPEAGPGPHDSRYLFAEFDRLMGGR
jgi:carbamoyl-phosphate synthase small subunit